MLAACGGDGVTGVADDSRVGVAEILGDDGSSAGYERALAPPELEFPRDHGPHRGFRTEWWYVTANLDTAAGRRFGILLVFFRQALAPRSAGEARVATLAAREMVLAHAAVTDIDGQRFHHAERLARSAAGLGSVTGGVDGPLQIVCADWSARAEVGGDGLLPLRLAAGDDDFAFELHVASGKPMVFQGDRGLSQKSAEPGNASIYYSLTRLPIRGTIALGDERHEVQGSGWLDREWSTSALGSDQVGWDWFSLQLDDDTEVMWYRLRRVDGSSDPWSRGCLVHSDGRVDRLLPDRMAVESNGQWTAADGGARYPARWRLVCEEPAFRLDVTPLLPDQELRTLVRYWEGAVAVTGTRGGRPVSGRGYLEMTGYVVGSSR